MKKICDDRKLEISFIRIPILDYSVTNVTTMKIILDVIDSSLKLGSPVYLHCWGGHGRTATVLGCWLKRSYNYSTEKILKIIVY